MSFNIDQGLSRFANQYDGLRFELEDQENDIIESEDEGSGVEEQGSSSSSSTSSMPSPAGLANSITPDLIVKVAKIGDYSVSNHSNIFSYIIFRIKNVVLSIFGMSDWQVAKNELVRTVSPLVPKVIADCVDLDDVVDRLMNAMLEAFELNASIEKEITNNQIKYATNPMAILPFLNEYSDIVQNRIVPILTQIRDNCINDDIRGIAGLILKAVPLVPALGMGILSGKINQVQLKQMAQKYSVEVVESMGKLNTPEFQTEVFGAISASAAPGQEMTPESVQSAMFSVMACKLMPVILDVANRALDELTALLNSADRQ